jgi:hypothetical protein
MNKKEIHAELRAMMAVELSFAKWPDVAVEYLRKELGSRLLKDKRFTKKELQEALKEIRGWRKETVSNKSMRERAMEFFKSL